MLENHIEIVTVDNGFIVRSAKQDYGRCHPMEQCHVFNDATELCKFLKKNVCLPKGFTFSSLNG